MFTDVTQDMSIYKEEIFGPVVVVHPFSSEQDVLGLSRISGGAVNFPSTPMRNLPRVVLTAAPHTSRTGDLQGRARVRQPLGS